jgi:hypothetical protein
VLLVLPRPCLSGDEQLEMRDLCQRNIHHTVWTFPQRSCGSDDVRIPSDFSQYQMHQCYMQVVVLGAEMSDLCGVSLVDNAQLCHLPEYWCESTGSVRADQTRADAAGVRA